MRVVDVMTFNIHHAQGTDGVLDLQRIADVIEASGADVVGLQEVDRHYSARSDWVDQAAALAELLEPRTPTAASTTCTSPIVCVR